MQYVGAYNPATTYNDGDYVIGPDGITYVCVVNGTVGIAPTPWPVTSIPYGTTLPSSPVDGQEAILVDSLTNPTFQWRFRYNAGNTTAYKWEFIGGTTARTAGGAVIGILQSTNSVDTGMPAITIPRAGGYRWVFGGNVYNAGTFVGAYATIIRVFANGVGVGSAAELRHHGITWDGACVSGDGEAALAAGAQLTISTWQDRPSSAGGNSSVTGTWLQVTPLNVA
jgi:hypothetical protein